MARPSPSIRALTTFGRYSGCFLAATTPTPTQSSMLGGVLSLVVEGEPGPCGQPRPSSRLGHMSSLRDVCGTGRSIERVNKQAGAHIRSPGVMATKDGGKTARLTWCSLLSVKVLGYRALYKSPPLALSIPSPLRPVRRGVGRLLGARIGEDSKRVPHARTAVFRRVPLLELLSASKYRLSMLKR